MAVRSASSWSCRSLVPSLSSRVDTADRAPTLALCLPVLHLASSFQSRWLCHLPGGHQDWFWWLQCFPWCSNLWTRGPLSADKSRGIRSSKRFALPLCAGLLSSPGESLIGTGSVASSGGLRLTWVSQHTLEVEHQPLVPMVSKVYLPPAPNFMVLLQGKPCKLSLVLMTSDQRSRAPELKGAAMLRPLNYSRFSSESEIGSYVTHTHDKKSYMPSPILARARSQYPYDYCSCSKDRDPWNNFNWGPMPYLCHFWNT